MSSLLGASLYLPIFNSACLSSVSREERGWRPSSKKNANEAKPSSPTIISNAIPIDRRQRIVTINTLIIQWDSFTWSVRWCASCPKWQVLIARWDGCCFSQRWHNILRVEEWETPLLDYNRMKPRRETTVVAVVVVVNNSIVEEENNDVTHQLLMDGPILHTHC